MSFKTVRETEFRIQGNYEQRKASVIQIDMGLRIKTILIIKPIFSSLEEAIEGP